MPTCRALSSARCTAASPPLPNPCAATRLPPAQLQEALEGLLDRYSVDVAIAGHHHRRAGLGGPARRPAGPRLGGCVRCAGCSALLALVRLQACPNLGTLLPSPAASCSYQRTCSVHAGACHPGRSRGTVHLCVGNAGADFYDNGFAQQPAWIEHEVGAGRGGCGKVCWVGWRGGPGRLALPC